MMDGHYIPSNGQGMLGGPVPAVSLVVAPPRIRAAISPEQNKWVENDTSSYTVDEGM